jgi:hypothetical protein
VGKWEIWYPVRLAARKSAEIAWMKEYAKTAGKGREQKDNFINKGF